MKYHSRQYCCCRVIFTTQDPIKISFHSSRNLRKYSVSNYIHHEQLLFSPAFRITITKVTFCHARVQGSILFITMDGWDYIKTKIDITYSKDKAGLLYLYFRMRGKKEKRRKEEKKKKESRSRESRGSFHSFMSTVLRIAYIQTYTP